MSSLNVFKSLAVAGMLAVSGASQAAITLYTSQSDFNDFTLNQRVDTFDNLIVDGSTTYVSPMTRSDGLYSYTASTLDGILVPTGTADNPQLSSNDLGESILFDNFSAGIQAAGANFFGTDFDGFVYPGSVRVTATDASGSVSLVIGNATENSFVGFVSDGQLLSFSVAAIQPRTGVEMWPTVDNLVLATAVPEPESYALMMLGLGVVGWAARRRGAAGTQATPA